MPMVVMTDRRHNLQFGELLAIPLGPCVGGNWFLVLVCKDAVRPDLEAQRRRKAFALRIARLAIDDQRDHPVGAAQHLEAADFLVDVFALRGIG